MNTVAVKKINPYFIAATVLIPAFFAILGTSATNVAIPHISGFLGATQNEANTVLTSYMIANALILPLSGWLTRLLGKKNVLYLSITFFTIGAGLCVISHSLTMLVLARIVQGLGGGAMMPLSQAILLEAFPAEQRGKAMGLFGLAMVLPPLIGPTFGGFLTDNLSWEWIFIVNIPIGFLSLFLTKTFIFDAPRIKEKYKKKIDIIGLLAIFVWLVSMQIVLDKGQQYNWFDSTWICWLSGISLFAMIFFIVWELEYKYPIVDIRVFKNLNFSIGTIIAGFVNMILYSTLMLLPMFLQNIMGYDAFTSGLAILPRVFSCFVMLVIVGQISDKIDNRLLTAVGLVILGVSTFMFTTLNLNVNLVSVAIPNLLLGAGIALTFIPISALAFGMLPKNKTHDGTGLHSLCKCMSAAIVTSISSSFVLRLSQVHQHYLVGNLSIYNPAFVNKINVLKTAYMTKLPALMAAKKANIILYKELLQQSKMYSFIDIFQFFALTSFILIPLVFLLKKNKPAK